MKVKSKGLLLVGATLVAALIIAAFIKPLIIEHVYKSLLRMVVGYLLAVALGVTAAILLGINDYVRMTFKPILSFFMSIPTITWVPILLVTTGISEKTIVIAIFLGAFFAIVYNTLDGFDNIDKDVLRAGRMLGYSQPQLFLKVKIPASFNSMLVGLKLGVAYAWRALVGAEMIAAVSAGLGYLVFTSRSFYNVGMMVVGLLLIGLLGYLLAKSIEVFVERKTVKRWGL